MASRPYNSYFSALQTRQIPYEHPRLLGNREHFKKLAKDRAEHYARMKHIALNVPINSDSRAVPDFAKHCSVWSKVMSLSLVSVVEDDAKLAREAIQIVFDRYINQPLAIGHVPFGADIAMCAFPYDLCHQHWTDEERKKFHAYFFATRDANVDEEPSVFHDGWWGYKNWGLILGCLAVMYETEKEPFMLSGIDRDFRLNGAPAQRFAGEGGGYPEGFYVNYYIFEWLLACEAMRINTGADYYSEAETFYKNRAVTQMFEHYPTLREHGSRRQICVGDGRGRFFKVERDRSLAAMRILVNRYGSDADHQAVAKYLDAHPRLSADEFAWIDFLFQNEGVKRRSLKNFKLSHCSPGPGYVYARSSWEEDATYFFFKCGKRFTAHQHLDVGHFYIFKNEELAGEGGHYSDFGGQHDANFYLRTIAHNSILVHDPEEKFEFIRGVTTEIGNDGGQRYPWPGTCFRHNGDASDLDQWKRHPELGDIADLLAYQDEGTFLYTAGDGTRAYSSKKLELWTRQIVFVRPGTFVIFDRVKSTRPEFTKTWVLHAMKPPEIRLSAGKQMSVTNGNGRLFIQTVLPASAELRLKQGETLYAYGEGNYPPKMKTGPEAECRIEISPPKPARMDLFLHVLTATDASVQSVQTGEATVGKDSVSLTLGKTRVDFGISKLGGSVTIAGKKLKLKDGIAQ